MRQLICQHTAQGLPFETVGIVGVKRLKQGGRLGGGEWPLLLSTLDFQVKTSALVVFARQEGFLFCLLVKGKYQVYYHNRLQLGNHKEQQRYPWGIRDLQTREGKCMEVECLC